jgi:hypothetical protein
LTGLTLQDELKDQKRIQEEMETAQRKLHAHIEAVEKDFSNAKRQLEVCCSTDTHAYNVHTH